MVSPSRVFGLPLADGVEVLEREADRIDVAMARGAHRVGAMPLELLAHGGRPVLVRALREIAARTAGGGSGGVFSRFEMMYLPRSTGDVRLATDVIDRMLPWPSRPRRFGSVTGTRRKREP